VLYLDNGSDFVSLIDYSGPINSVAYGDGGNDQIYLVSGSSVAFGGLGLDSIIIGPAIEDAIVFGGEDIDFIFLDGKPANSYAPGLREGYIWGGADTDIITQRSLSLISSSNPFNDWLMDFDSSRPSEDGGGDLIRFSYKIGDFIADHTWDRSTTELREHHADDSHPFLSDGETYYELRAQSAANGNWYSVLNLVGINGATITLDGLFANGNLL
jgi:hypothetical protein